MVLFLVATLILGSKVQAEPSAKPAAIEAKPASDSGEGEYEIDYEEEPDSQVEEEVPEVPAPGKKSKKASGSKNAGGPAVQGSRAKNRFAPILKSETKSVYKKEGRALDVDAD